VTKNFVDREIEKGTITKRDAPYLRFYFHGKMVSNSTRLFWDLDFEGDILFLAVRLERPEVSESLLRSGELTTDSL
jgi:hypothetical protein